MPAPQEPYDEVGQGKRRARLFQHRADEGPENDDDTDGREGPGKAGADNERNLFEGNPGCKSQQQGDGKDGQEGVYPEFRDQQDHGHDGHDKSDEKWNSGH